MAIVLDGTANTVTPLNGALGATTPSTVVATTVVASSTIKGATTIAVGNATPSASGAGITFPATQSASTDANTLDDYEEGTWTPVFTGGGGSIGSTAYSDRQGTYTKVGNVVTLEMNVTMSSVGSWSGEVIFTGLPFAGAANIQHVGALSVGGVTFTGYLQTRLPPNETVMTLYKNTSGSAASSINVSDCSASSSFRINITYRI